MAEQQGYRLGALDHVNLRTARVDQLAAFYCDLLGLARGWRPPFAFGGAWLYCGDKPVVHLVEAPDATPRSSDPDSDPDPLGLTHFAFSGTGMVALIARLRRVNIPHRLARLPGTQVVQVNLRDPDGNALHIDFNDAGPDVPLGDWP